MREIKFRAWDGKKMVDDMQSICWHISGECGLGEGVEIMQYIGLKDKNGKEIYEGDIVCTEYNPGNHENCHKQFHDVVEYKDGTYSTFNPANGYEYGSDPNECEVLGNIYENTELVQSK